MAGLYFYTPYIWPMLVSAIFSAALGVYAWRHRTVPGAPAFAVQELFLALWALLTAMEMAAGVPVKILHHKLEAAAALAALTATFYFALEYAGPGKWATRRTALLLSFVVLCTIILIATNDLHHLLWTRLWFDQVVRVERGPLSPLLGLGIVFPALSILIFLRLFLRSQGIYRQQALLLGIGTALPILTFFLELAGINLLAPLDPVMLAWGVSSALYAIAIFRFHMLGVVPVGRDTAIERMANGVLVLDAEERIVDLNPAAGEVLALSRAATIGRPAAQALAAHGDLSGFLAQKTAATTEITLHKAGQPRTFQVQASSLTHPSGFHLGRLIMLHDVTEEQRVRAQAQEQQRSLAVLRERERLARELHDSIGQVLGYAGLQLEVILDRITDGRAALPAGQGAGANAHLVEAEDHATRLGRILEEAHADVREHILNLRLAPSDQRPFFATLRQYLDGYCQNYGIQAELSVGPGVDERRLDVPTQTELFRIIQEALSNARKHAEAGRVQITLETQDGQLQMRVEDNGRGFDPAQAMGDGDGHYGLRTMHERAEQLGGQLSVRSAPGAGTCVVADLPIGGHPREECQ